jgi:hypothetical protein
MLNALAATVGEPGSSVLAQSKHEDTRSRLYQANKDLHEYAEEQELLVGINVCCVVVVTR